MKSIEELKNAEAKLKAEYENYKSMGLKLNMARGKPSDAQLDTVERLLGAITHTEDCFTQDGIDCRNYGVLDGIPEAKRLFASMLEVTPEEVIVGGNSSLNLMYDTLARAMSHGVKAGCRPWSKYEKISFLCPVPGYDRHFAICEYMGINMINVPMTPEGPDMDIVEMYVSSDETIKGIWCVPKYSNPTGVSYSDETVRRFARLRPKAEDFRVFWDCAYVLHDINDTPDYVLNILDEAKPYGNEDMFYLFASTSKITYPGAGIAAMACSKANVKMITEELKIQTIGYDKLNQLRHCRIFPDFESLKAQMQVHLEIIRPKFMAVLEAFDREFSGLENISYTRPNGGYFISLDVPDGCASKVVELAAKAGVVVTSAGATFPYGIDPNDRNIRIAPTYPTLDELKQALKVLCCCVKLAAVEKQLLSVNN